MLGRFGNVRNSFNFPLGELGKWPGDMPMSFLKWIPNKLADSG
jgi:hypothetical protein